ncbi:MFS transporter [Metabacillus sp. GX 13764]|uniref:MFS transporter n=1 Tax=Metabacillus kandeliae TaxID=2900151 RepID=UPI001E642134|nr:MFS transporter [Metabacillus kandeliae]MCD7035224.1 MFS transporter [Metabacillus kandeliae]
MSPNQRKQMLILMVNMFIAIGSFGIIIPILPAYLASIHQGGIAAGLMIAIFAGAQLVFSPVAGRWADVYGRKKMIVYGLSGLTLSMFIFYGTDSIWLLYASRVVGGIGAAFLIPAIFAYIADITTIEQRARGNSMISAAMSLGIVIGPGIGGFLADYGLKMPFLVSALVSLVSVIFSIAVLKESQSAEDIEAAKHAPKAESMLKKIAMSGSTPYFIPLVITLVMSFGLLAYESVLGLFVAKQYGASPQQIAWMITATGIVSVIVQLFIVDRIVTKFGEGAVLNFFLGVAAAGFLLTLFAKDYNLFFGITLLIFLASSILRPVLNTLISKMAGKEQGFAMGLNNAYMSIGNVLGPTCAGLLYDVHILYPFVLGALLLGATLLITIYWQRKTAQKGLKKSYQ